MHQEKQQLLYFLLSPRYFLKESRVFALSGYGVKTFFVLLVPIYIVGTSEPAEF